MTKLHKRMPWKMGLIAALLAFSAPNARAQEAAPPPCPEGEVCQVEPATAPAPDAATPVEGQVQMGPPENVSPVELEEASIQPLPPAPPLPPPVNKPKLRHVGVGFDIGVLDGAGLDLVFRPYRWVRATGGLTYNSIALGLHGGLTLIPLGWGPSATAELGRAFQGNVNSTYGTHEPVLSSVGYDYANLHLGWEFGSRRATFFIHGGESHIEYRPRNVNQQFNSSQVTFTQGPEVRAWIPSFKLGLIVFFG